MATTREAILQAIALLVAGDPFFPAPAVDEAEPSEWFDVIDAGGGLLHAAGVQDGPPPDQLAFVRGAEGEALDELELEAAFAYAVQGVTLPGQTAADVRAARRARRDLAVERFAALIAANRTLGLGVDVWADVQPAQRDDDVAFENAAATATAVVPVRVLYTAAHAAA